MDRFVDDMDRFASIPVLFRSFVDGDRRVHDRDGRESDRDTLKSVHFRAIEGPNRHFRVPFRTKSVVDRSKTDRFLVGNVAFMSKVVPIRSEMDLFLNKRVRFLNKSGESVKYAGEVAILSYTMRAHPGAVEGLYRTRSAQIHAFLSSHIFTACVKRTYRNNVPSKSGQ